jgi:hypothetical protein
MRRTAIAITALIVLSTAACGTSEPTTHVAQITPQPAALADAVLDMEMPALERRLRGAVANRSTAHAVGAQVALAQK